MYQLLLAVVNISPWIIAITYDLVLYIARRVWHEVPVWGGRARGEIRPRAPSMRNPTRRLSIAEMIGSSSSSRPIREDQNDELRRRYQQHQKTRSVESISEEQEEASHYGRP